MKKKHNYCNSVCSGINTPVPFSSDPYITAAKGMLTDELKQIAYYIQNIKAFNIDMSEYRDKLIEFISVLIVNSDFRRESFFVIIDDLYKNKLNLKQIYTDLCEKNHVTAVTLNDDEINLSSPGEVLKALNFHERRSGDENISRNAKILIRVILSIALNACNRLIELKNFDVNLEKEKDEVLSFINAVNNSEAGEEYLKQKIIDFLPSNFKIIDSLIRIISEKFGPVVKNEVNTGLKSGKAILVSGYSLSELEHVLNAVKGTDINVYTHHEVIRAFQYKKFLEFKNLAGHYQPHKSDFRVEFSSFPGPVFISGNAMPKIDVVRGRIFTSAKYPEFGIGRIENNDFAPVIDYALDSKGFDNPVIKSPLKIGYSEVETCAKTAEITDMLNTGKIRHVYIIGHLNSADEENQYIKEFCEVCGKDCYIISFAHNREGENFWKADSIFDFPLLYKIISEFFKNVENAADKISVTIIDCNSSTLSHIFNLIYFGVKNIHLGPCCPNVIHPDIINGLDELFGINPVTTPAEDIKKEEE